MSLMLFLSMVQAYESKNKRYIICHNGGIRFFNDERFCSSFGRFTFISEGFFQKFCGVYCRNADYAEKPYKLCSEKIKYSVAYRKVVFRHNGACMQFLCN